MRIQQSKDNIYSHLRGFKNILCLSYIPFSAFSKTKWLTAQRSPSQQSEVAPLPALLTHALVPAKATHLQFALTEVAMLCTVPTKESVKQFGSYTKTLEPCRITGEKH